MPNIDTVCLDVRKLIVAQLPPRTRAASLKALCLASKATCDTYQPILFDNVFIVSAVDFTKVAYALAHKPGLADYITKAYVYFEDFETYNIQIDRSLAEKAKTMSFWTSDWQKKLDEADPRALCGLLIALLPNLKEFEMNTRQMARDTMSPDGDEKYPDGTVVQNDYYHYYYVDNEDAMTETLPEILVTTNDVFGIAAQMNPQLLPKMEKLHTWKSQGLMPTFSLMFPSLETIKFAVDQHTIPRVISSADLLPLNAPAYKSVTSVTIQLDMTLLTGLYQSRLLVCIREFLDRLERLDKITIILDINYIMEMNESETIFFNQLTQVLSGTAKSLTITWLPNIWKTVVNRIQPATFLPNLQLTHNLEIPEILLLIDENADHTVFDHVNASSVFGMQTLKIVNATRRLKKVLTSILQHRRWKFFNLKRIHLSYMEESRLLEQDDESDQSGGEDGKASDDEDEDSVDAVKEQIKADQKIHAYLCDELVKAGIEVVRDYDDAPFPLNIRW